MTPIYGLYPETELIEETWGKYVFKHRWLEVPKTGDFDRVALYTEVFDQFGSPVKINGLGNLYCSTRSVSRCQQVSYSQGISSLWRSVWDDLWMDTHHHLNALLNPLKEGMTAYVPELKQFMEGMLWTSSTPMRQ